MWIRRLFDVSVRNFGRYLGNLWPPKETLPDKIELFDNLFNPSYVLGLKDKNTINQTHNNHPNQNQI
jgi:hypothetical protein